MSAGLHRRPVTLRKWRPTSRIAPALVGVVTLVGSMLVITDASAAEDAPPAPTWVVTSSTTPDSGGTVAPGSDVTYRLSVANTAKVSATTAVTVVDDVASVLKAATISTSAADLAKAGLAVDADKGLVTWTVAPVPAGGTATANFTVTIAPDAAGGSTLTTAAAVKDAATPCAAGDACATTLTIAVAPKSTAVTSSSPSVEKTTAETSSGPSSDPSGSSAAKVLAAAATPEASASASPTPSPTQSSSTPESSTSTTSSSTSTSALATTTSTSTPSAAPKAKAALAAAAPLVVPPPGTNQSVITVSVGSDRSGTAGVTPLAGAVLALYDTATASTATTFVTPNICTSDVDGDCSWTVANTGTGGSNQNRRFWVKQVSAPAGYYANLSLAAQSDFDDVASHPYTFQTGTQLLGGQTYTSTADFMIGTGSGYNASQGVWQNSRNNPGFTAACGIKVAIVADLSGSVRPDLANLQGAANTLVSSLTGTPSTVSLFTFATTSPAAGANNANQPALNTVSTAAGAAQVTSYINAWTIPTGNQQYTNWDQAFATVANQSQKYDIVVVITDGNPTVYSTNLTPVQTRFREVENGIYSANAIKAKGTRMVALGVGAGIGGAPDNLRAISGPVPYTNTTTPFDFYQSADYTAAGNALKALALGNCQGTVTVVKQVQPPGTTPGSTAGGVATGGWTFGATVSPTTVTVTPASGQTAQTTGALNFNLNFPGGVTTATATLAETQQTGYTLNQIGGANAVCTRIDTGAAVPVTNGAGTAFSVPVGNTDPVTCTVYNIAPQPPATVTVTKQWVIDGVTYPNGSQPPALQAALTIAGQPESWGNERTGFNAGQSVPLDESATIAGFSLCTITSSRLTSANGSTVNAALPYTAVLVSGTNTYQITNTATCPARLTLDKQVINGPALATAWTLTATAPTGAIAGPTGTTGVTGPVSPMTTYPLSESAGDPRYVQLVGTGANAIPGSTISWVCQQVNPTTGAQIAGYSDGLNGGVTIPRGYAVVCTARNETAPLTLVKHVVNDNGGTATAADWTLTATPVAPPTVPAGLVAQGVTGSETAGVANTVYVRPGQSYTLSESGGPAGYTPSAWSCTDGTLTGSTLVTALGDTPVCTITNDDVAPQLSLVKNVWSPYGGTAVAGNWTLSANGTGGFSGAGGTAAVTNQPVLANTPYILGESTVTGYANGATWSCSPGTFVTEISLGPGVSATCTITNTEIQPKLTLVKKVFDQNGVDITTPALAAQWTLTATGIGGFSGAANTPAVTAIGVNLERHLHAVGDDCPRLHQRCHLVVHRRRYLHQPEPDRAVVRR